MSQFDILADELGAVAGRIEREVTLRVTAALADFARRDAERELILQRALADINERVNARIASIKDGRDGIDGAAGRDGVDGRDGIDGKDGTNGTDGKDGAAGERGLQGPEGPVGKLPIVKEWGAGVHYEGAVTLHRGATFQALRDTGTEPGTSEDWQCIAAAGTNGQDGRSLKIRGTYTAEKEFAAFDVVACNGGSFVALKDGAGICPGPDWQLIAGPGKRGDKGLPGDKGLRGEPGADGVGIEGWIVNEKDYEAIPVMGDGTKGPAVNMRGLFEQFLAETR